MGVKEPRVLLCFLGATWHPLLPWMACHAGGREFESRRPRHLFQTGALPPNPPAATARGPQEPHSVSAWPRRAWPFSRGLCQRTSRWSRLLQRRDAVKSGCAAADTVLVWMGCSQSRIRSRDACSGRSTIQTSCWNSATPVTRGPWRGNTHTCGSRASCRHRPNDRDTGANRQLSFADAKDRRELSVNGRHKAHQASYAGVRADRDYWVFLGAAARDDAPTPGAKKRSRHGDVR